MLLHTGARELCHTYSCEQQAGPLDGGAFWATGTVCTHHFLHGHTQTMGHVWSAWGPNPEEGQMVSGIEDRTPINMRKEGDRGGGGQVPSLLYSPSKEIRGG